MKQLKINNCPIVYYTKRHDTSSQWILFIHSAFVDHHMFDKQIDFFSRKLQNCFLHSSTIQRHLLISIHCWKCEERVAIKIKR